MGDQTLVNVALIGYEISTFEGTQTNLDMILGNLL